MIIQRWGVGILLLSDGAVWVITSPEYIRDAVAVENLFYEVDQQQ